MAPAAARHWRKDLDQSLVLFIPVVSSLGHGLAHAGVDRSRPRPPSQRAGGEQRRCLQPRSLDPLNLGSQPTECLARRRTCSRTERKKSAHGAVRTTRVLRMTLGSLSAPLDRNAHGEGGSRRADACNTSSRQRRTRQVLRRTSSASLPRRRADWSFSFSIFPTAAGRGRAAAERPARPVVVRSWDRLRHGVQVVRIAPEKRYNAAWVPARGTTAPRRVRASPAAVCALRLTRSQLTSVAHGESGFLHARGIGRHASAGPARPADCYRSAHSPNSGEWRNVSNEVHINRIVRRLGAIARRMRR